MNDKKDVRVMARQCSNASSVSTGSGTSRSSLGSKGTKETASRRSSISSTTSTASRALSHTLSSTQRFIDPSRRVEPSSIERIDGLRIKLLDADEDGRAALARLLNERQDVCHSMYDWDRRKFLGFLLPAVSQALKLEFNVSLPNGATKLSWIHLWSCRRRKEDWADRVDVFIRDCAIRLFQISDPTNAYIKLPPCFYLEKVDFDLGLSSGCATFAWLGFDASWIRRTMKSGLVTEMGGSLCQWQGEPGYGKAYPYILYDQADGRSVDAQVPSSRIDSSRAFPRWLNTRDKEDFAAWCGVPEAVEEGGMACYRNFLVKNIRLNYFGDVVRATLVRAPGAPTSLPERPKPEPVKKKGFLYRQRLR